MGVRVVDTGQVAIWTADDLSVYKSDGIIASDPYQPAFSEHATISDTPTVQISTGGGILTIIRSESIAAAEVRSVWAGSSYAHKSDGATVADLPAAKLHFYTNMLRGEFVIDYASDDATEFRLEWGTSPGDHSNHVTVTANLPQTLVPISDVLPGWGNYYVICYAVNAAGDGTPYGEILVEVIPADALQITTGFTIKVDPPGILSGLPILKSETVRISATPAIQVVPTGAVATATAIYGRAKYGGALYGAAAVYPFKVRVEHWHGPAMVQRLDPVLEDAAWEYIRFGGCGQGTFTVSLPYELAGEFAADDEIRVYCRGEAGPATSLYYRGLLCRMEPMLGVKDRITLNTMGYRLYLDRITVDETYDNTELSVIVRDLLDTIVCPNCPITYDIADIETTTFTADSVSFCCTVAEAMDMLAKLAGMMEYGVDRNGKFFFRTPSSTVAYRFPREKDVTEERDSYNWEDVVNRVIVRGAGSTKRTREDLNSQNKYGIRSRIVHNTAATTNAVADEYGDAILADQAEPKPSGKITLAANRTLIESTRPLPLVTRMQDRVLYGQVKYGSGSHYQATAKYKIARINYKLSDLGLTTSLELGAIRPRLSDLIFQLNSNIRMARPT